jgi:hypothetical protein
VAKRLFGRQCGAGTRAKANGYIKHIERRDSLKKFEPTSGHAEHQGWVVAGHHVRAARLCQAQSVFAGGLEVVTFLDQLRTQRPHGGILFGGIAQRDHDGAGHAVACCRISDALAMVAPCGADYFGGHLA